MKIECQYWNLCKNWLCIKVRMGRPGLKILLEIHLSSWATGLFYLLVLSAPDNFPNQHYTGHLTQI